MSWRLNKKYEKCARISWPMLTFLFELVIWSTSEKNTYIHWQRIGTATCNNNSGNNVTTNTNEEWTTAGVALPNDRLTDWRTASRFAQKCTKFVGTFSITSYKKHKMPLQILFGRSHTWWKRCHQCIFARVHTITLRKQMNFPFHSIDGVNVHEHAKWWHSGSLRMQKSQHSLLFVRYLHFNRIISILRPSIIASDFFWFQGLELI